MERPGGEANGLTRIANLADVVQQPGHGQGIAGISTQSPMDREEVMLVMARECAEQTSGARGQRGELGPPIGCKPTQQRQRLKYSPDHRSAQANREKLILNVSSTKSSKSALRPGETIAL